MENPLVAVIASSAAESRVKARGFNSISRLLQPFAAHTVVVKDPSTAQSVSANVTLEFNDLNKEGHLLTLSVLPHVLFEILRSKPNLNDAISRFQAGLRKWAEPSEMETFRTYLACIFVISSSEENPMSELSRLVQLQHTQQHSPGDSKELTPSHCGPPKWTTPNTLKHYFLLHDISRDDEERSTEVFNEMCSTYGADACQMVRIGDGAVAHDSSNVWREDEELDAVLLIGLRRALQHATASAMAQQSTEPRSSAASVSTISPSYAVVQSSPPSTTLNGYPGDDQHLSLEQHAISEADRETLRGATEKFLKDSLVPHVERLMRTLQEQLAARRGLIGKSLTSGMKKWFGGGSAGNLATLSTVSFSPESLEMQSRRLADLAFMFGLYSFAFSCYRSVKKDFEHSQAWLHHAAASEMAAVACFLSEKSISPKQFPRHYFEVALENLLNYSGKYTSIMRCALNASSILSNMSMFKEAAALLSTVANLDSDMCVAVTQTQASRNFDEAKMTRKAAFYRVLAGNRFMKAGLKHNALECYRLALHKYVDTSWESVKDHLSSILSKDSADRALAIDCAVRILRENAIQSEANHRLFLLNFIDTMTRFSASSESDPVILPVPLLDVQATRVICGERPRAEDVPLNKDILWIDIERAAFYALAGSSATFRPTHLVSDNDTDNQHVRSTPPDERFRVEVHLRNPLKTPLTLHNVRLGVTDVHMKDGSHNDHPFNGQELLPSITFLPDESKTIELWVRPSCHVSSFRIASILLQLSGPDNSIVYGCLPMHVKGKRLNKNPKQMKALVYATDERLRVNVTQKHWPLIDFRIARKNQPQVYCGQAVVLNVQLENIGRELVDALCLATDGVDSVSVEVLNKDGVRTVVESSCANSSTRVFMFGSTKIHVGEKTWLSVVVRAPATSDEKSAVGLVFYYRGENSVYRQWQTVVSMSTVPLFDASAVVLDETHSIASIRMRNVLPANDAALARCEVLRIRIAGHHLDDEGRWNETLPTNVSILPMKQGSVQLECEQSCTLCVVIDVQEPKGGESISKELCWLLGPVPADPPSWPSALPNFCKSLEESQCLHDSYFQLAILWRASVVDNEGHVSSIIGETFVEEPVTCSKLKVLRAEQLSSQEGSMLPSIERVQSVTCDDNSLNISCRPIKPIIHNFQLSRLCRIPIEILVINTDNKKRAARLTLKYKPKVFEPVSSPAQLPLENRQQWWVDREVVKATVECGENHFFRFVISVSQPSVYDVAGMHLILEASFDDNVVKVFKIPSTIAIVTST